MIQRIQTVYLILAALSSGSLFALPFFNGSANVPFFSDGVYNIYDSPPLLAFTAIAIIEAIITIFMYKNRPKQAIFCVGAMLSQFILVGIMLFLLNQQFPLANVFDKLSIGLGSFAPILLTIFIILANRGIKADEKLVRSMDRLR